MADPDNIDSTSNTDGGSAAAVAEPQQQRKPVPQKNKPKQLPPYKVLLHNDDVNDMVHVIISIIKLTPLNLQQAEMRMLEAHQKGVALLLVTHKERAELYAEQFRSLKLIVTIEPDA